MACLYTNVGTIGTPQIAPISIDQNWRDLHPWHVTWGQGNHEVYSTAGEAVARATAIIDRAFADAVDWMTKNFEGDPSTEQRHEWAQMALACKPRVFPNSAIQGEYDARERKNAEQVVAEAKRQFANERLRQFAGYQHWTDAIARGLDRMRRLYPDLLA